MKGDICLQKLRKQYYGRELQCATRSLTKMSTVGHIGVVITTFCCKDRHSGPTIGNCGIKHLKMRIAMTDTLAFYDVAFCGGWRRLNHTELSLGHHLGDVHGGLGVQSDGARLNSGSASSQCHVYYQLILQVFVNTAAIRQITQQHFRSIRSDLLGLYALPT